MQRAKEIEKSFSGLGPAQGMKSYLGKIQSDRSMYLQSAHAAKARNDQVIFTTFLTQWITLLRARLQLFWTTFKCWTVKYGPSMFKQTEALRSRSCSK